MEWYTLLTSDVPVHTENILPRETLGCATTESSWPLQQLAVSMDGLLFHCIFKREHKAFLPLHLKKSTRLHALPSGHFPRS
jgi:hypothetical protein